MKTVALVMLMAVAMTGVSGSSMTSQGGCYCPEKHPQQKFCDDSLVIKGTVRDIRPGETTGQGRGMNMDMMIEVEINEVFKSSEQLEEGNTIFLHTYGMCRFERMLKTGQEFVLSATDAYQPGYYIILRGCSWVQKWNSLTREQRNGLRGEYHNCDACEITKTSMTPQTIFDDYSFLVPSPLGDEDSVSYCFHNQQMAMAMDHYVDCETLYSACVPKAEGCDWSETKEYKRCMRQRVKIGGKTGKTRGKKSKGPKAKAKRGPRGG